MFAKIVNSSVIIAGTGSFGCCLANQLCSAEEQVTVIDSDSGVFQQLAADFTGLTVEGDASDIEILHRSGISHCKALVAATNNDNTNLMIAGIAHDIYAVPTVIAVVSDPNLLALKDKFNFTLLCPAMVMTQTVIEDLNKKEGSK